MTTCVILHNMIVEDEGELAEEAIDLNVVPGASIALPPEVQKVRNMEYSILLVMSELSTMRCDRALGLLLQVHGH